jgi:nitric oxide reductase subunit C
MDNEKAARLGRLLFFIGSAACLIAMFGYLTPTTLAYINKSNHMDNGRGVPADVVRGKQAFHKFVCMDCHTILGDGTQYAPELGRVGISRDPNFLKLYIKDARAINPNTGMPKMAITDQEAEDLVAFLTWTSKINLPEDLWAEMKAKQDPYDPRAYDEKTNPFFRSYWPPRPMK